MQSAAEGIARYALGGARSEDGAAYERMVDSSKEAKAGPWRPYLEVLVQRFNRAIPAEELLEKVVKLLAGHAHVDSVYDPRALVFSNNFITTIGGTENAVALWRYLVAPMRRTDMLIQGICARFVPKGGPGAAGPLLPQQEELGQAAEAAPVPAGRLELLVFSEQRWHLPAILLLPRLVFGDELCVRVQSLLRIDPASGGKVVYQSDTVDNWLFLPAPLRLLLGLSVPLTRALLRPW
ncbi:hypothetical protein Rsub_12830 [Raphidocelis subcapitata]|uniref:Uncharacterized protein n=1 Tax=Raphidocelis subcapitata TaxID=307507 RepID=A0A2V0PK16_9CHLO|nr:hypothetical protein Rsub_12830 [Raphidocelis subcapitata]|eukprot:GBG00139.1 hypothetical protein Rsub_12830 [Raphidocelis subcapitata]